MKTSELFEAVNAPLEGYFDINALASLLPDVNNDESFESAMTKVRLGQAAFLTVPEKMQLALAFISLVGLDGPQKTMVMRQIISVKNGPVAAPAQAQQPAPAQNQQNPENPPPRT